MQYPVTCSQAAESLGVAPSTVSRIAAKHGIGRKIGSARVLSKDDLAAVKAKIRGKPGNPNFTPGNHFGKPKKKSRK